MGVGLMQGPLPRLRGAPDLSSTRPLVNNDSTAISRLTSTESAEVCTNSTFAHSRQHHHHEDFSLTEQRSGKSSDSAGAPTPLIKRRGSSCSGRAAHRIKPLTSDDDWELSASRSPFAHTTAPQHVQHSNIIKALSATLPVASKVVAARESLLRQPSIN